MAEPVSTPDAVPRPPSLPKCRHCGTICWQRYGAIGVGCEGRQAEEQARRGAQVSGAVEPPEQRIAERLACNNSLPCPERATAKVIVGHPCPGCNGDGTRWVVTDQSPERAGWIRRERVLAIIDDAIRNRSRSWTTVTAQANAVLDALEQVRAALESEAP